jgi:hypothetical protein
MCRHTAPACPHARTASYSARTYAVASLTRIGSILHLTSRLLYDVGRTPAGCAARPLNLHDTQRFPFATGTSTGTGSGGPQKLSPWRHLTIPHRSSVKAELAGAQWRHSATSVQSKSIYPSIIIASREFPQGEKRSTTHAMCLLAYRASDSSQHIPFFRCNTKQFFE